ncbi:DUF6283 family protein [Actinomadura luteofluorescens]
MTVCGAATHGRRWRVRAGGRAGCHGGNELLALGIAVMLAAMTPQTAAAVRDYHSPIPLFTSGAEAAVHGLRDLAQNWSQGLADQVGGMSCSW